MEPMTDRAKVWALVGLLLGSTSGCSRPGSFQCESDSQCVLGERSGQCTVEGYCAFEDETCESRWVYGELAGEGLGGSCVPVVDGSGTGPMTAVTSTTSTGTSTTQSADESGPSQCPQGAPCTPSDPCALSGVCDAFGACLATEVLECDLPGPCYALPAQCTPDGECLFDPQPPGFPCDDGSECTVGDSCDGAGACIPGPSCESGDPCEVGFCTREGSCFYEAAPDGESCGPNLADRCCEGRCVDISSDEDHCGGCYAGCSADQQCESIDQTPKCPESGSEISGRCTCELSADCPMGHECEDSGPYPGRCDPLEGACHGVHVSPGLCPDFCGYEE